MLKWTPEQAYAADVNLILMALEAHGDMLKSIFGTADQLDVPKPAARRGATVAEYLAFSKRANLRYHPRGRRPVNKPVRTKGGAGGT